jgi:hypothetical protein
MVEIRSVAMKKKNVPAFVVLFLLFSQIVAAQGFGEYGRLLGGMGQKGGSSVPKGATSGTEVRGSVKQRSSDSGVPEKNPMPSAFVVESNEAALYARSEEWADKITQLSRGEKLVPMVQATGAKALWYMVKTQTGAIGWVKSSDVVPAVVKSE